MSALTETPTTPSEQDVALAQESSRRLAAFAGHNLAISVQAKGKAVNIELPAPAVEMLLKVLAEMAEGNAVTLMPIHALLTTQQAANILGVSRPFIVEQMKNGQLKFQKVGTHRRIAYTDVAAYCAKMAEESNAAMDALVSQAQELGLGY